MCDHSSLCLDLTTTSVGRSTIVDTYESFLGNVRFSGTFRMVVTIDPAYGVDSAEMASTRAYLRALPERDARVREVIIDEFSRPVGLVKALSVLMAHARGPYGVHLEDDWEIIGPVDLDALIEDLDDLESTEIVLANTHVARGGTFERDGEWEPVVGSNAKLIRLTASSWAANYLPLCPHIHRTAVWAPTMLRALALTDDNRCPDERVKEYLVQTGEANAHHVLWTADVVARDIGREWLRARGLYKAHVPEFARAVMTGLPVRASGEQLVLQRSFAMRARADRLIPGTTQTFMKRPECFAEGEYPMYLDRGDGAVVWDVDGNCYVDYVCALGAATLGYNHPVVTNTIRDRIGRGVLLSLPSQVEITAAELLVEAVPGVERVRFLKTGAEACSAAVRLARNHTGRDRILVIGYHGWHDQFTPRTAGVPAAVSALVERTVVDDEADEGRVLELAEREGSELAAVIFAAPYHRILSPRFLPSLRQACSRLGVMLILDEIVTGFRLAPGGIGELYGVAGDVLCFAKGLAAGMPLAAVAGPATILDSLAETRVSSTYGGELLSLEVMKAVLREYAAGDYYSHIATLGSRLADGLNGAAESVGLPRIAYGYPAMPCLRFSADPDVHSARSRAFLAALAQRGVLFRRDVNFLSAAHDRHQVDATIDAAAVALANLKATWW
jgi:aminotransferase MxcL